MSSNNYWTDRRQNQRIEEAEAQLASERRARNRLSQQMKEQQGNLEGQIKRLTTALVALIEHEDIRAELGQYSDAANCRRYARDVVSTVVVTGGAALRGSVVPREVPGYWLSSAAQGVAALAQGEAGGDALLTRASQEDPGRAATFLAMLGAATHDDRWASSDLGRALPSEASVTGAQRQVWLAIADGRLNRQGGETRSELHAALRQQVQAAGEAASAEVTAWLEGRAGSGSKQVPAERAADLLTTLRSMLEGGAPAAAPDTDNTPRLIGSMLGEDSAGGTDGRSEAAEAPAEDPLADCLRSLIEEGSPGEGDILDRMAQARTDLGFLDEKTARMEAAWTAPAGSVIDLLLVDLDEPADSPRKALAQQVLTPTLTALADSLAGQAAVPPADQTTVKVAGETITITPTGATDWKPGVIAGLTRRNPRNKQILPLAVAALCVGVISIGLAFVAPIFWLLAVLGIVVGAGVLFTELKARRDSQETQRFTLDRTERDVSKAAAILKDEAARSAVALSRATDERRAVQDLLAQG